MSNLKSYANWRSITSDPPTDNIAGLVCDGNKSYPGVFNCEEKKWSMVNGRPFPKDEELILWSYFPDPPVSDVADMVEFDPREFTMAQMVGIAQESTPVTILVTPIMDPNSGELIYCSLEPKGRLFAKQEATGRSLLCHVFKPGAPIVSHSERIDSSELTS